MTPQVGFEPGAFNSQTVLSFSEAFAEDPINQALSKIPPRINRGGISRITIPLFNTCDRAPCCAAAVL